MFDSECIVGLGEQRAELDEITLLIEASKEIVVCAHTNPDGDALGSLLALAELIEAKWPEKHVVRMLADNEDPVPRIYRFLPRSEDFVHPEEYSDVPDLFLCVDLPSAPRLNHARSVMERSRHVAVIDHHPCEEPFGEAHVARTGAAAAGIIVAEYAKQLGVELTPGMADCLYCAITTDTGRFQYQNSDAEAFHIAGALVDAGARPDVVSLYVYQSFRPEYLHLKALVLGRITTFSHGKIAYSYCQLSDLERTGAHQDECDGLVDIVRSVEGADLILFLKEMPGGKIRGNLRSKCELDVSHVAHAMGGGGHRKASGFKAEGPIDRVLDEVLPLLKALVEGNGGDTTVMKALRV